MSKKALIFWPRLDCTFKEGPCGSHEIPIGDLPVVRQWWHQFLSMLAGDLVAMKYEVHIIKKPLWQMKPEDADEYKPDFTYVPHRLPEHFPLPEAYGPRYYMQTVLPWLFSISPHGWGARLEPEIRGLIDRTDLPHSDALKIIRQYQVLGFSKFPQAPSRPYPKKDYALFVCQLPHDDTIKYFSDVSVFEALERTSDLARAADVPLIVKGHIANPASQRQLLDFAKALGHTTHLDEWNIIDLMRNARAVFSVNSGTTIEAMAMGKLVFRYGEAEYNMVVPKVPQPMDGQAYQHAIHQLLRHDHTSDLSIAYKKWLDTWYKVCYDASNARGGSGLLSF